MLNLVHCMVLIMAQIKSASSLTNIAEYLRITYGYDNQTAQKEAQQVIDKILLLNKDSFHSASPLSSNKQLKLSIFLTHQTH